VLDGVEHDLVPGEPTSAELRHTLPERLQLTAALRGEHFSPGRSADSKRGRDGRLRVPVQVLDEEPVLAPSISFAPGDMDVPAAHGRLKLKKAASDGTGSLMPRRGAADIV